MGGPENIRRADLENKSAVDPQTVTTIDANLQPQVIPEEDHENCQHKVTEGLKTEPQPFPKRNHGASPKATTATSLNPCKETRGAPV
jgi:hypothetical protein